MSPFKPQRTCFEHEVANSLGAHIEASLQQSALEFRKGEEAVAILVV